MERAPLRPVPSRPPRPIAPAEAIRHVTAELPGLDDPAAGALALRALVGLTREQIADASDPPSVADLSGEPLAEALARGRKALRRSLYPLPGSGWCERAERLISDRLDEVLADPGPRRLDVHLANCSRCVEHERRLAQSQDALVESFSDPHPAQDAEAESTPDEAQVDGGEEAAGSAPPLLRAVDTPILLPAPKPEAPPAPAAVRAGWRRSSATLWSPASPEPERVVASTPAPVPPSDPAPPAPPASTWTSEPPRTWSPPPQGANAWRSDAPRPSLAARRALESEDVWTALGPLVAVLSVAMVVGVLAALLAVG